MKRRTQAVKCKNYPLSLRFVSIIRGRILSALFVILHKNTVFQKGNENEKKRVKSSSSFHSFVQIIQNKSNMWKTIDI